MKTQGVSAHSMRNHTPFCERGQDADAQWVTFIWPGNFIPIAELKRCRSIPSSVVVLEFRCCDFNCWQRLQQENLQLTCYGLDGQGIESRWRRDFPQPSRPALGPTPASYTMGTGALPGVKRPGGGVEHPLPSIADVKERVELPLLPLWDLVACYRVNFTFSFNLRLCEDSCKPFRVLCAPKDQSSFKSLPSHSKGLKNLTGLVLTKLKL